MAGKPESADERPPVLVPDPVRKRALLLGLCAFVLSVVMLVPSALEVGPSWDEAYYMAFTDCIEAWVRSGMSLDEASLADTWGHEPEHNPHPPGIKVVSAVVRLLGASHLPFPLSYRLGPILFNALGLALIVYLIAAWVDVWTGVVAGGLLFLQPRFFAHAGFIATDMPVALAWLVVPLVFWRLCECPASARARWGWVLAVGLFWGVCTASKFPACLVFGPLLVWLLVRRRWRETRELGVAVALVVVVFLAVSPVHWVHPVGAVLDFVLYPFKGVQVAFWTYYLGRALQTPELPWHYVPVILGTTLVPVSLLALPFALLELGRKAEPSIRALGGLLALLLGTWLVLGLLHSTPKHDVIRQLLPLAVLLAFTGAFGVRWVSRFAGRRWPQVRRLPAVVAVACACLPAVSFSAYRNAGLSYYNVFTGGVQGADKVGLCSISYWLEQVDRDFTGAMNGTLPEGARITMEPNPAHLSFLQDKGWVRPDLVVVPTRERASFVLLVRNDGLMDLGVFRGVQYSIVERRVMGVPVARLFRIRQ